MGVDVPDDYEIDLNLDGGVTLDGDMQIDSDLRIRELPRIEIGVTEIPEVQIGITRIPKIKLGVDPVDLSIRLKEIPSIRMHLPAQFRVGMSLLGRELMAISLCGEAQVITEDYVPNPCEDCSPGNEKAEAENLSVIGLVNRDG